MASGNASGFQTFRHIMDDLSIKAIMHTTAAWFYVTCRRTTLDITTSGLTQISLDGAVRRQCFSLSQVKQIYVLKFLFSGLIFFNFCVCGVSLVFA